jgi:hypothetical protein
VKARHRDRLGPVAVGDSFEAWPENPHDDMVLAIAVAAWVGERAMREFWISVYQGPVTGWPGKFP